MRLGQEAAVEKQKEAEGWDIEKMRLKQEADRLEVEKMRLKQEVEFQRMWQYVDDQLKRDEVHKGSPSSPMEDVEQRTRRRLEAEEAFDEKPRGRQVEAASWKLQAEAESLTLAEVHNRQEGAGRKRRGDEKDELKEAHAEVELSLIHI